MQEQKIGQQQLLVLIKGLQCLHWSCA